MSPFAPRRAAFAVASSILLALGAIAGCQPGEVIDAVEPPPVEDDSTTVAVTVLPESAVVAIGDTFQFSAQGRNLRNESGAVDVDWEVDDGDASVTSTGQFTATREGSFLVIGKGRNRRQPKDTSIVFVGPVAPTMIDIVISPATVSVQTGATQQFSAVGRLSNGNNSPVVATYSATGGSVNGQGVYTAGGTAGSFRVIATAGSFADTAAVTVTAAPPPPPTLVAVELTPPSISLQSGTTQQFSVVGRLSNGGTQAVTPTYSATGGTVSGSGLYTAGATAGTFRVVAAFNGLADTSSVTITAAPPPPPTLVAIELTPPNASLQTGATQQFSVIGRLSNGGTQAVTPTYSATGGNVSSGGLYTAGGTAGTFRVIASANGLADTSAITITAAPPPPPTLVAIEMTPPSTSIETGATQQFTVIGRLSNGGTQAVTPTYSATGGTVSSGGLYAAGGTAGTFRVIASANGFADTSSVTLTAPAPTLVAIELTPPTISLQSGATQQFSTVGRLSNGGTQAVTATYTATGGTVSTGGLYTAGGTAGSFRVIASASGFADTSAVTVTAAPPPPPTLVAIELTPASVSLGSGATQQFSAIGRLSDGGTQAVTPTYTATGGTVSTGGLYTAGATSGTFRVIASASGFADTSSVTITPVLVAIELTPATASVAAGATQQFNVIGRLSNGGTQAVTSTYSATGGTINGSGLYTAGGTTGSFRVIASANGFADTSAVTITPAAPTLVAVELTPATASVQSGATQQFSTIGRLSNGGTQAVTATYTATGGTISSGGLYTAGATAGTNFRVIAAASGFADTSAVTVTAAPPPTLVAIEMTPSSVSINTGASQQFSVIGRLSNGGTQAVTATYTATGGTISSGGMYDAGGTAGSFRAIASANGFADTSSITLTAPGGFAPPDLVNLSFNDPAQDNLIETGGANFPGQWHQADATGGRNGSRAVRITVSSQFDNGYEPVGPSWPNRGRVFLRWYFRTQGTPGGNVKGFRFHSNFSNNGELYGGSPCWAFDHEPSAAPGACFSNGLYYNGASSDDLGFGIVPTCTNLADGNWHWIEVDYDRNAGANVEVRIWCDGKAVVLPVGAAWFGGWNTTVPAVQWVGGNVATNTPTTWRTARIAENFLSGVFMWPTISQAGGTATVWIDDVAASSQRIGP